MMWAIMALSLLSGLCTPLGAYAVLRLPSLSQSTLAFILALASGVMVTVAVTELMPASLHSGGILWFVLGLLSGIFLLAGISHIWRDTAARNFTTLSANRLRHTGRSIALAIAVHDVPEGIAIGAGDLLHAKLGVILALAMALHNVPEGMSIAAPLAWAGESRRRILRLTGGISLVTPLGTLLPLLLGSVSPSLNAYLLALAGGAMLYVVAHDTLPESWYAQKGSTLLGLMAGVALMVLLATVHTDWLS